MKMEKIIVNARATMPRRGLIEVRRGSSRKEEIALNGWHRTGAGWQFIKSKGRTDGEPGGI